MSTVVILGASPKPDRYAHQAQLRLQDAGHQVFPVRPHMAEILGVPCYGDLPAVMATGISIDCLTLYLGPDRLRAMITDIVSLRPGVIIANPGTDDAQIMQALRDAGLRVEQACTLVLLATGRFASVLA